MPNSYAPAQIDFNQLANLPNQYRQGQQYQQQQQLRNAFSGGLPMNNGAVDFNAMAQMFAQQGDPRTAASLAQTQANTQFRQSPKPTTQMQNAEFFAGLPEGDPRKAYAPKSNTPGAATSAGQDAWPSVQKQLDRMTGVLSQEEAPGKKRFTKQDFEWGLGPVVGDPTNDFGTRAAQRATALIEPWMSDSARGVELRDTIEGEASGLLKMIQPIIRTKGEGSQSDIEFKAIRDLLGSLTKSKTPEEYARRMADVKGRVQNLLHIAASEPDVGGEIDPNDVTDNGDGTGTTSDGRKVRWVD